MEAGVIVLGLIGFFVFILLIRIVPIGLWITAKTAGAGI